MNFIIPPLETLVGKLTLFWRFVIITSMVAVALFTLVIGAISTQVALRTTTLTEQKGVMLYLPTINIQLTLQNLRSISILKQVDPSSQVSQAKIDELTDDIDKNFAKLADLVKANSIPGLDEKYSSMYNGWIKLKSMQNDANVDKFHLYDDYLDQPKNFLKFISAKFKLNLDSDANTYYYIEMVSIQFPELLESFNMLKDLSLQSLYKNTMDDSTLNYLGYSISIYEQNTDMIDGYIDNIDVVTDDDKILTKELKSLTNALNSFELRKFIEAHLLNRKLDYPPNELKESMSTLNTNASRIFSLLAEHINTQLDERLQILKFEITKNILISIIVILLIGLFFVAFYRTTQRALKSSTDIANEIAQGNLLVNIPKDSKDDFNVLFTAFDRMQQNLSEIVGDINEVGATVNSSAREIASGNSNLSERTQEQASALVETAASLNNLTDTVRKNADSARDATTLANKSSNIAQEGRNSVGKVLITMNEINDSAQRIQEITAVIDSIAFQTNLLALNASVEAARAGEQGRGFAVVASEVRNLAQRSSDAAKQIKGLINDSMSKVEAGDKQVKLTADTMQEILESITQVDSIVKQIAVASSEQSNGIEQINIVVSGMEDSTQKNAALVEEAAASAELLEKQSNKLVEVMSRFTL